jgi:hypothetical protein
MVPKNGFARPASLKNTTTTKDDQPRHRGGNITLMLLTSGVTKHDRDTNRLLPPQDRKRDQGPPQVGPLEEVKVRRLFCLHFPRYGDSFEVELHHLEFALDVVTGDTAVQAAECLGGGFSFAFSQQPGWKSKRLAFVLRLARGRPTHEATRAGSTES